MKHTTLLLVLLALITRASADCLTNSENCAGSSDGCCDSTRSCFAKTSTASYCKTACPTDFVNAAGNNVVWDCEGTCIEGNDNCMDNNGEPLQCCSGGYTCERKSDTYGQCKATCPYGRDPAWECETAAPTLAPTQQPTAVPTQAPTRCLLTNEGNCLSAGNAGMTCCDADATCEKRGDGYGQCKTACPYDRDPAWECETLAPTTAPTPTPAPTEKCYEESAGNCRAGGETNKCCDESLTCWEKADYYGECKVTCPANEAWACYTSPPTTSPTTSPTEAPLPKMTLRDAASNLTTPLPIGCVINYAFIDNPAKVNDHTEEDLEEYLALAATQYNWLTEENGCKWRYSEQHDRYRCVYMLEFAEAHGMDYRGHALVWGKAASNPDFFDEECIYDEDGNLPGRCKSVVPTYTVDQKYKIMNEHVKNESEYYAGRLAAWDVVNEAVCDCWLSFDSCEEFVAANPDNCGKSDRYSGAESDVYLKKNIYWPDMPDYISQAFIETKKYDTVALLGYNEYKFEAGTGWQKEKSDMTYQLVKSLVEEGVPIDYIGSQTHIDLGYMTYETGGGSTSTNHDSSLSYLDSVKANMDRYATIGVEWHFTELTIAMESVEDTFDAQAEEDQAALYKGLLDLCLAEEKCTCFQTWGFVDGWTNAYNGLLAYPFGTDYEGKDAFVELMSSMDPVYEKIYGDPCLVYLYGECQSDNDCCDEEASCFVKSTYYSQCRESCPDNADWDCWEGVESIFSGSTGELGLAGAALLSVLVGLGIFTKRIITDYRRGPPAGLAGEEDNIDLTSADTDAMFFRTHNAFEEEEGGKHGGIKEKGVGGIVSGDDKL